jgi:prepilin-type N-terminal cleavage/methylation domain-containing protein
MPRDPISSRHAFTLIELLIVIAIITILISLAFSVIPMALNQAKKTEALTLAQSVHNGFISYLGEYRRWPASQAGSPNIDSPTTYAMLSGAVASAKADLNTREIVFVEFPNKFLDNRNPTLATTFFDPWKNNFEIRIDHDLDGEIADLPDTRNKTGTININATAAIWSKGSKGSKETNQRNYISTW